MIIVTVKFQIPDCVTDGVVAAEAEEGNGDGSKIFIASLPSQWSSRSKTIIGADEDLF